MRVKIYIMFILGHLGVTLGVTFIIDQLILKKGTKKIKKMSNINYLLIAIGSLLPDLIDKPIGHILLRDSVSYGRLFGHTLLFLFGVAIVGYFLKSHRNNIFCLLFGTSMHLLEDRMWKMPNILLYPLYGFSFPNGVVIGDKWYDYFIFIFNRSYKPTNNIVFLSEILGILFLIALVIFSIYKAKGTYKKI